jgi:hypothetical protein
MVLIQKSVAIRAGVLFVQKLIFLVGKNIDVIMILRMGD